MRIDYIVYPMLLMATMIACTDNTAFLPETTGIAVEVDGIMGEYDQNESSKAGLTGSVRVKWGKGDKVYVYDAQRYLGELTVSLKDNRDYYAVLSSQAQIVTPQAGTTKLTLIYSNAVTSAPAISDGKIKIDISAQTGGTLPDNIPFVAYGTLDYNSGATQINGQVADFSLATSIMRLNCTGLEAGVGIHEARLTGMSNECLLDVTGNGASVGQGKMGAINISFSEVAAGAKGAQTLYAAISRSATSTEQSLKIRQSKKHIYSFGSRTRECGKAFNAICQMEDMIYIPALFSVGETKTVQFSSGNLYYDGTGWGFEDEQYYFRTYCDDSNNGGKCDAGGYSPESGTANGHWGLFGWIGESSALDSSPEIYGVTISKAEYSEDYGYTSDENLKRDWGTVIDNNNTWRTLTLDEWGYLLNSRFDASESKKYGYATVNSVYGIIIIPDGDFDDPHTNNGEKLFRSGSLSYPKWGDNLYNDSGWIAMEDAGAVFLPAAGYRDGQAVSNSYSYYWSSTGGKYSSANDCEAFKLSFGDGEVHVDKTNAAFQRRNGCSVRLVHDVSN